jgi:putative beta-lysine N-acetyltransferase
VIEEFKSETASLSAYIDHFNKRIRVDAYEGEVKEILQLLRKHKADWAEKIIIKSKAQDVCFWEDNGFQQEAFIKGYFSGSDMYFHTSYPVTSRKQNPKYAEEKILIDSLLKESIPNSPIDTSEVVVATEKDANELTALYAAVFMTYPTPISEPGYVLKTMNEGTVYVVIRQNNKIVSAASAEINKRFSNAELTDCATLPQAQGKGHMKKLLHKLEEILSQQHIHCLYTIARAESYSMNKAFYQLQYTYGGLMTNNCIIYSGLEDMNVWYKLI